MTTLTVTTTTDYRSQVLSGVDTIVFSQVYDYVQAVFSAAQFDGVQIAADVTFDSGPAYNYLYVTVGGGVLLDARQWKFSNW